MSGRTIKVDWVDRIKLNTSLRFRIDLYNTISKNNLITSYTAKDIVEILKSVLNEQEDFLDSIDKKSIFK